MQHGRAFLTAGLLLALLLSSERGAVTQSAPAAGEFGRTIKPLLQTHCYSCHGAKGKPKADLNLTAFTTDASLRDNRKVWKQAVRLLNSHEMPPPEGKPPLAQLDRERLVKSIDAVLGWVDPKAPLNPGRVTVRRLNRTEYGNTVRDLLGVDFDPAEDFPSDDIGHGFDNIGDVLTLSPMLMERYLSAAEALIQRAFPADRPPPSENRQSSRFLEPAGRFGEVRYRLVTGAPGAPPQTGPLFNRYRMDPEGEYVFSFRVFAKAPGAKVAVLACGKDLPKPAGDAEIAKLSGAALPQLRPFRVLETVEVKGTGERDARRVEVKIPPQAGIERLAVALVKGPGKEPPNEISIDAFTLRGPLDSRPVFQRRLVDAVARKPKAEQTKDILKAVASRAYRRPATDTEVARLVAFVDRSEKDGAKWEAALGLAFQAVLVSPKFLFRVELDARPEQPEAHAITEHQLASRLSYFLWASTPDDELLALAAKGQLGANLEPQVCRMLKDPRARELIDSFAMQWLQLKRISFVAPDGGLFPSFNQRLRQSMLKETELFFDAVIREDRSVLDFIAADWTFLDERLARHYGINDTAGNRQGQKPAKPGGQPIRGDTFVRVSLQDGERGGLLAQASVLTVTSNPTRTSPVKRGRWVLEQILGEPPPPPPPDVPELVETSAAQQSGSLKQRMEQHRADPKCANCHARMDAIGFALENYNAIGAWRTTDGKFPVDASGMFPDGASFKGPGDLRKVLLDRKDLFVRCLVEKMMIYGLGRGIEPYDDPAIRQIQAALAKDGHKFSRLMIEIVKSAPFRMRRGMNSKE